MWEPIELFTGISIAPLELAGVIFGLLALALLVINNVWTWPVGMAQAVCTSIVFYQARLYGDLALQVMFFCLAIVGWWNWVRRGPGGHHVEVRAANSRQRISLLILLGVLCIAGLLIFVRGLQGSYPVPQGIVWAIAVTATVAQIMRFVEQWYLWLLSNLISLPIYFLSGLVLLVIQYIVFIVLCIFGLIKWRSLNQQQQSQAKAAT